MSVEQPIIFFDGVCNLCNRSVQFVLTRDKPGLFRFASLQSAFAQKFLARFPGDHGDSVLLYKDGRLYSRSNAALHIAGDLGFPWSMAKVFLLIPALLRDPVYRFIARNRYRWFGKRETCMMPEPGWAERFLGV